MSKLNRGTGWEADDHSKNGYRLYPGLLGPVSSRLTFSEKYQPQKNRSSIPMLNRLIHQRSLREAVRTYALLRFRQPNGVFKKVFDFLFVYKRCSFPIKISKPNRLNFFNPGKDLSLATEHVTKVTYKRALRKPSE